MVITHSADQAAQNAWKQKSLVPFPPFIPESLTSLSASFSEKEDISSGGTLDALSNPRKETLLQYTTSSDSSGLSLEQTWIRKGKKYV